jgi:uncharacterized protein YbaP (TraB family)
MNGILTQRLRKTAVRLLVLLAVFGTYQAHAQSGAKAEQSGRRFLFWKATSPTATVYLLGSVHLGTPDYYPLPASMESAFAASKVLAVEINVKDVDPNGLLGPVQEQGMYKEGDSLSQHIPHETSDALDKFCSSSGLPRDMFERFKPWLAAMTITVLAAERDGQDPKLGIDLHFLNEVTPPQRVEELESADFQMSVLSSGSEQEQQELLASTLKQAEKANESTQALKRAYLAGSEGEIEQKMEESMPKSFYKRLLDDRNVKMAAHIEDYLKGSQQCFVVVGAGHLIGEKGIVKILQDKNYHVERVAP